MKIFRLNRFNDMEEDLSVFMLKMNDVHRC